jgi:hypothetical protein
MIAGPAAELSTSTVDDHNSTVLRRLTVRLDGRWMVVALAIVMWFAILLLFATYGYEKTWKLWNVPVFSPPFVDFRLIPGSAESLRSGFDPVLNNPGDPLHRTFNYPALWYLLFKTGITQADTTWMSIAMLVAFFIAVFAFPGPLTSLDAVLMLLMLFSPAAMLLYERANVDALVFVVCALGLILADASVGLATCVFLFGAMLKIFPFFGLIVLVRNGFKAFARLLLGAAVSFGVYLAATAKSVSASWSQTERGNDISYGANVLFQHFGGQFYGMASRWLPANAARWSVLLAPYVLGLVIVLLAITVAVQPDKMAASKVPVRSQKNLDAFRVGAAIYVGTFFFGNNWDYRLIFLLFALPQLSQWTVDGGGRYRIISGAAAVFALLSCWYLRLGYSRTTMLFVLDECAKWGLLASLTYLLAASLRSRQCVPRTRMRAFGAPSVSAAVIT